MSRLLAISLVLLPLAGCGGTRVVAVDRATGAPVAGAEILAVDRDDARLAVTGGDGSARLSLADPLVLVAVRHPGYARREVPAGDLARDPRVVLVPAWQSDFHLGRGEHLPVVVPDPCHCPGTR